MSVGGTCRGQSIASLSQSARGCLRALPLLLLFTGFADDDLFGSWRAVQQRSLRAALRCLGLLYFVNNELRF